MRPLPANARVEERDYAAKPVVAQDYRRRRANAAPPVTQDVRRCDDNPAQATSSYWEVTYQFQGREHSMQLAHPPGQTVTVNRKGEPRA
jgi:hypothetical protein